MSLVARDIAGVGRGIFASAPIDPGALLAVFGGVVMPIDREENASADRAMQIHDHFVLGCREGETEDVEFFNHSCDPNAGFRGQILLYAMRPISAEEEVTFDYAMVLHGDTIPYNYGFDCRCGRPGCRRHITGHDWKLPVLQHRYRGYFQQYLQDKIDKLR